MRKTKSRASRNSHPFSIGLAATVICLVTSSNLHADAKLLKTHCSKCHSGDEPKGDFNLQDLGKNPSSDSVDFWVTSLDYVKAGEMPPAKKSRLSDSDRAKIVEFLEQAVHKYDAQASRSTRTAPRRLNNRELANSIADVLMIEDVGTHEPTANVLGDTLHEGFDTNGDALGISEFHLEQYIDALRKIVDAMILSGDRPETKRVTVSPENLRLTDLSNRRRNERANRTAKSIDILDMRKHAYFDNFDEVPTTGRYRIKILAMGKDRTIYDSEATGHYEGDPIRLRVHLGDRKRDFDLPDDEIGELELDEWLAEGTRIRLTHHTDALRLMGNGNFKFQYRIAHDYIKENNQSLYDKVAAKVARAPKSRGLGHWSSWTDYWQGPRPQLYGAEIEGPIYESWPPKRQVALLGENPTADRAEEILKPIARRAWRREVIDGELDTIVALVKERAKTVNDIEALKEGIVAVMVSPSFLLINPDEGTSEDRFATKVSYFLSSTTPGEQLRKDVKAGELDTHDHVLHLVRRYFDTGMADEFLDEFPYAWMQLDRINFMAPDPMAYKFYDRKRISDDMIDEVRHFFRHAIERNIPIPELLTADYSFVNADLAKVYGIEGVPRDSKFRKQRFRDGRRGGLLGMGAFLTLTADSLGTSPIHRAIYVMENFLGIHPDPPPADVKIEEPDVRAATTIKEVLEAHRSDKTCASCHQRIDPYGYAFENFDPMGAWRDEYIEKDKPIDVDSSAQFLNGQDYDDIKEFRRLMQTPANQERFIRCFITKLLTYANGEAPEDYSEVQRIMDRSAEHDYRIVDTIAAVIDSPLFREE